MALNASTASGGGAVIERLDAGAYPARLIQVIDLGVQEQRSYKGKDKPNATFISLTYELLDEFLKDDDGNEVADKPYVISEKFPLFNLSSDRARSTDRYTSLDQELKHNGDFSKLINTPCTLTISKDQGADGRYWNNVSGVSSMRPKDVDKAPPAINPLIFFDMEDPDVKVYEMLTDYLKNIILAGPEFKDSKLSSMVGSGEAAKDEKEKDW